MAEAKKAKSADASTAEALAKIEQGVQLGFHEMGSLLDNMVAHEENELTAEYFKLEPKEEARVWILGITRIKAIVPEGHEDTGEMTDAVDILDEDGTRKINADVVIVSTAQKIDPSTFPVPVLIQCTGKAGSALRQYKTFKIVRLSAN